MDRDATKAAPGQDVIDLEDCFLDSPPYRDRLTKCDQHVQDVEHCLRNVLKTARGVINATHGIQTFVITAHRRLGVG